MREIKFRAKSLLGGEWVYGGYYNMPDGLKDKTRHIVVTHNDTGLQTRHEPIDIKTLGQCTGVKESFNLIDEPEKKVIFEGDIIQSDEWEPIYLVDFDDGKFIAREIGNYNGNIFFKRDRDLRDIWWPWIIGNKSDNPELMEARK